LATDEDLDRRFGSSRLLIGFPVTSDPYEEQNQALLKEHGASKAWVERNNESGLVASLVVEYPNGEQDLIFHNDDPSPTTQSFVTLSPETPRPGTESSSPPPNA
jgi:hypothetical protein